MVAELGHILLITAFVIALAQTCVPLWGAKTNNVQMMSFGDQAARLQCLVLIGAFALLTTSFIRSDFSVKLVADHSHSAKPLLYKISGVWGNHEGSMLLWVLILAIYGAMVPIFGKSLPASLKARAIGIQGLLGVGFLGFLLFTSNPFWRLSPSPADGAGLNPLLQDPGLALHPPFLYLGYVGFSLSFSFACAALIEGKVDAIWARWLRPWVLLAWSFLTIGITLGSLWAYYELGWGGWWMWDPVENVSFMPWLAGTALLHSILVLGTRHALPSWTVLLAIATFSLSLIGTFVVRSGVLISVHTFAVDPQRGIYILSLLALYTGAALSLYAWRSRILQTHNSFEPASKSGALVLNNLLLIIATSTVFLGTFYPLLIEAISDNKLTVGAPYFDKTFTPIMIILILVMGVGPLLKWNNETSTKAMKIFSKLFGFFVVAFLLTIALGGSVGGGIGIGLALYLLAGVCFVIIKRRHKLRQQSAAFYGFIAGHLGMAVLTLAITAMTVWGGDNAARLKIGDSLTIGQHSFTLTDMENGRQNNYEYLRGTFKVEKSGRELKSLSAEQRYYPVRDMVTTEAGFNLGLIDTVFAALSEGDRDKGWVVRVYYQPLVVWIWIGGFLIALGGFISLADRRLRFRPAQEEA